MHKKQVDKRIMPFFDAFRTTAAIGLLMQQTAALYCPAGSQLNPSAYTYQTRFEAGVRVISPEMKDSIDFIDELKVLLEQGYSLLAASASDERHDVIRKLDPALSDLIELQLRGLEGGLKNIFKNCIDSDKELLLPYLVTIAQARSASAKLNHLIHQMTKPVAEFRSEIDIKGLRALAKHGTETFFSGRFH